MLENEFFHISATITGPTNEEVWAQTAALHHLQVVLVLKGIGSRDIGHELLNYLSEKDQQPGKKTLSVLLSHLEEIKGKIPPEIQLFSVLALPTGKVLYIVCNGGAVYLWRQEKLVRLIEGNEKASGLLKDGDLVILGNQNFFQVIGPEVLSFSLDHFTPEEIAERLATKISEAEDNIGCAALILSFKKREVLKEEEIDQEEPEIEENNLTPAKKNFLAGIVAKIKSLKSVYPDLPRTFHLPDGEVNGKNRKVLLTVALVLITMLTLSIFFGFNKTRESEQKQKFESYYQSASLKYEEGKSLLGLNDVLARNRLIEARQQLDEIKKIPSLKNEQLKRTKDLEEKIGQNMVALSHIYKLGPLPLFWETGLIKEKSEGDSLAVFEDKMAILDRKDHLIFSLSMKTKAVKSSGGDNLKDEPKLIGIHGENIYALTTGGIIRFDSQNKNQPVVAYDSDWKDLVSLVSYGGNLYLLDRGKGDQAETQGPGQIWKYISTENGFSPKRPYFPSDVKPDFPRAKDLAVDGSVWVLLPGEILKFTQGRMDSFTISGLEGSFGEPTAIFANEKSKNLYLLDPQNKKVLVLAKDGAYQAQYEAEEIGQARDLAVSEEEKKIFILTGRKIYYIEIKS